MSSSRATDAGKGKRTCSVVSLILMAAMLIPLPPPLRQTGGSVSVPINLGTNQAILDRFDSIGDYLIENRGQVSDLIRFYSRGDPSVAFRDDGVMFVTGDPKGRAEIDMGLRTDPFHSSAFRTEETAMTRFTAFLLRFDGSNPVSPVGREQLSFKSNFFIGNDPSKWSTDVRTYGEVEYRNLYDGIDLVYRPDRNGVKYEFIVDPGADPGIIRMRYEGIDSLQLDGTGVVVRAAAAEMHDSSPYSYQENGREVDCRFAVQSAFSYGFDCSGWDPSKPLTIDPVVYSTFLGESKQEHASSIVVDATGNAYVTGYTQSVSFPTTPGSYDRSLDGPYDVFLVKLDQLGRNLLFATFLGGSGGEYGPDVVLDLSRNIYVAGETYSDDFPVTPGAFDTTFGTTGSMTGYVAKLTPSANAIIYATYIGNSSTHLSALAVDSAGSVYVTGDTCDLTFPVTPGAFDTDQVMCPVPYVVKLSPSASAVEYGTYIGDSMSAFGIAVDSGGNAYITGYTFSPGFPVTPGAFDTSYNGNMDSFVTKLNSSGSGLVYSTFLGGSFNDYGHYIALDSANNAYVTGETISLDFPATLGAYDETRSGFEDAFVVALNDQGSSLVFGTYLGGALSDQGDAVAIDAAGNAYITGVTSSADFPTTVETFDDSINGGADVFVAKLDNTGVRLEYSTFLGGSDYEAGVAVAVDSAGDVYVAGGTYSADFPTTSGSYDVSYGGDGDAFVAKIDLTAMINLPDLTLDPTDISFSPPSPVLVGTPVTISATIRNIGQGDASAIRVRFNDGMMPSIQIDGDQILSFIRRLSGTGMTSVPWIATPQGGHIICVLADPDDEIYESNESNNIACEFLTVFFPPDLLPRSMSVDPAPPLVNGTSAQVNVTIANDGQMPAGAFDVLLFDDENTNMVPEAGENISLSSLAGLDSYTETNISVAWVASPAGNHGLCAFADPSPGSVAETNETNNVICMNVTVLSSAVTGPDYIPLDPIPSSPVTVGLSLTTSLSVSVRNQGNATATAEATLAFYNDTSPASPFANFTVQPIAPATNTSMFTATWLCPATPGSYHLSVNVDYYDNIAEWDETNNVYTWTIECVAGPITSLVIGVPNYTSIVTYVRSSTPLDFSIIDQSGLGTRNTTYTIDGGSPVNYTATGTFSLTGEGEHTIEWFSVDYAGNVENVSSTVLRVDDTPPAASYSVGDPKHQSAQLFVTSTTAINLTSVDGGATPVGLDMIEYRIDGPTWNTYSSNITLTGSDGPHTVYYRSKDLLDNVETEESLTLFLDDTPPATTMSPAIGEFNVTTSFTLTATDGGSGVRVTRYRIDGGTLTDYSVGFTLPEGDHNISYYSIDNLDNTEEEKWLVVTIQGPPPPNTPPTVTITSPTGGEEFIKGSSHTITWTMHDDEDVNANLTVYVNYTSGGTTVSIVAAVKGIESFLWTPPDIEASDVVVNVTVIDTGGMKAWDESGPFTVRVPTQPPEVEANCKPLVAVAFVIILAVVGIWSSKKRPWKNGMETMAVAKAFSIVSLPFVLAEAATGVASFLTGQLSIPPLVGPGTALDLAILLSGVVVAILRTMRKGPSEAGEMNST